VALRLGASPATLAAAVREARHTHYPVYDRDLDRISGFVHVKDILRLLLANAPLDAGVVRPVPFVPETSPLEHVVAAMHEARSQMAVVMDEHGGTAGLITIEDVSAEILGQTVEADGRTLEWSRDAKGRVRAAGTLRLEELGEILGVDLGHEEVESVSGLLLHLQGRPPARGDTVTWRGLRFRVTRVVGRGVRECVVEPVQPPREDSTPAAPTEG
jgi:CBS domain containing-hemolysin-like protein